MQTYIDYLPIDVIREHIIPHLNYNERNGLNMCIPTVDRIPMRMNKLSIEKHEQGFLVPIIKEYLDRSFWPPGTIQIKNMIKLFKLLQHPRYFVIVQRSSNFRSTIIAKIQELTQSLIDMKENVELCARLKLVSQLKKLRNKIYTSGPYTDLRLDYVPSLSFN